MSAGLYGLAGGANRKIKKLYASVGGVSRDVKELWAVHDGVNRKIFQSAIEWTYAIELSTGGEDENVVSYGNSSTISSFLGMGADSHAQCEVTYTFSSPLLMRAGQTLSIDSYNHNDDGYTSVYVYVNGSSMYYYRNETNDNNVGDTYEFTEDTEVSAIMAHVYVSSTGIPDNNGHLTVRVNSEFGSFILNDSGIYEPV